MMKLKILVAVVLAAFAVTGCGRSGGSADDLNGHNHDENLQLAMYNDRFEVYAEVSPLAVGKSSEVLAHFTWLDNFRPLESGMVTVSLIVDTDGIRQAVECPSHPGIYKFTLTPAKAGQARMVFDIAAADGVSQLVIRGLRVYDDVHEAEHAAADAAVSGPNGAVFTKEQSWKVDFATEEARMEPFGEIIKTTAQILPSQGDERVVTAKAGGLVTFPSGDITDGRSVGAGQTLFAIESGDMAEGNLSVRYDEAAGEYNRTKAEYERKKALAGDRIVSQSDLLQAETRYRNAETVYNNLRRNFSNGKQIVTSPIAGYVKEVFVDNGQYVAAGQPVAAVSQNRTLLIRAELQPRYYPVLGSITTANLRVMNTDKTYTLEQLDGRILSYGRSTDVSNPLVPVTFRVNNSAGLLPGTFVQMYIKTITDSQAVTVPNEAIVEEMGNHFVYVQLTPEFFEKRIVRTGAADGFRIQILEGVQAGERVVSKGAVLVKLAQSSGALDPHAGHVH